MSFIRGSTVFWNSKAYYDFALFSQFFDRNKDGFVSILDISQVLPVGKLPQVPLPQEKRRRGRGSRERGAKSVTHGNQVPVTLEQEMPEEETKTSMDFGMFTEQDFDLSGTSERMDTFGTYFVLCM